MTSLSIQGLSHSLNQQKILDNLNLDIEQGEFLAIVGPSGSGKSTLLRLIAGLDAVTEGKILVNDNCVNQIPPAKRDIAMVFQSYALYPHMTVYANMAYGLKMQGLPKQQIHARVEAVAEMLKISHFLQRKPAALSGGQRQRVAMGRAIVREPALFLFDEPLSNLDAKLRAEMRQEIKKLHQSLKITSIYVTHDQIEAMTLADKILLMNHGKIEQLGTPYELYHQPQSLFVASFIGHYPINFIPAAYDATTESIKTALGFELPMAGLSPAALGNGELILAIRPEHLQLAAAKDPKAIACRLEFVEDMGSDKLLHLSTAVKLPETSERKALRPISLKLRIMAEQQYAPEMLWLHLCLDKALLFSKETGQRIGGWNGQSEAGYTDNGSTAL